ncbi:MAG TPA: hypothetical protein VIZ44_05355 [Gaiellaceae bacterium]
MFRQPHRARGGNRLADAGRNLPAGAELPDRVRPLTVLRARGEQLAALA